MGTLFNLITADFWSVLTKFGAFQALWAIGRVGGQKVFYFWFQKNKAKERFRSVLKKASIIPDPINGFAPYMKAVQRCASRFEDHDKHLEPIWKQKEKFQDLLEELLDSGASPDQETLDQLRSFKID